MKEQQRDAMHPTSSALYFPAFPLFSIIRHDPRQNPKIECKMYQLVVNAHYDNTFDLTRSDVIIWRL